MLSRKMPWLWLGAPVVVFSTHPALALEEDTTGVEEIIVTAQRVAANLQDVPMTVTAVTNAQIEELNIFRFEDVAQLSPGLSLQSQGSFGSTAQLRGVGFDSNASASPAVDIYVNETPVDPNFAFQSIYDIGQIEVLRGPQGTLRGRPAPGGAVTLTWRKPDLNEFGGSIAVAASDQDAVNTEAAVNVPLATGKLALRVAGVYDENDANKVRSVNSGARAARDTDSWRTSLRWAPTDAVDITLAHQRLTTDRVAPVWIEGPGMGYNGPAIGAGDRLAVQEIASSGRQESDITTLNASWELERHRFVYNGARQDNSFRNLQDLDPQNGVLGYSQLQSTRSDTTVDSHELRLESIGDGRFADYAVGLWYLKTESTTSFTQPSALDGAFGNPLSPSPLGPVDADYLLPVAGLIPVDSLNYAIYSNTTMHLTERTDLRLGVRLLRDEMERSEAISTGAGLTAVGIAPGVPMQFVIPGGCPALAIAQPIGFTGNEPFAGYCDLGLAASSNARASEETHEEWVYDASLAHHFTDDLMLYVSYGHSWRPAGVTVGVTVPVSPDLISGDPESSDSYEIGLRSEWLDGRLRLNASVFYQEFENFIGRFDDVPFVGAGNAISPSGFTYPGDAVVDGAEIDLVANITDDFWVQLTAATADGHFDDARVPCRDTDLDGVPDDGDIGALTLADFGGNTVRYSITDERISTTPKWSATLQSQYAFPVFQFEGFVRGLYAYQGDEQKSNAAFKRDPYGILNVYTGIRGVSSNWEVSLWAKNVLDDDTVLARGQQQSQFGFPSGYNAVSLPLEREVGVTLRYGFGGN
jgi:iron complex outermembrane recepter protein